MEAAFEKVANVIAKAMGRPLAFVVCALLVVVGLPVGRYFTSPTLGSS